VRTRLDASEGGKAQPGGLASALQAAAERRRAGAGAAAGSEGAAVVQGDWRGAARAPVERAWHHARVFFTTTSLSRPLEGRSGRRVCVVGGGVVGDHVCGAHGACA
jgi:hypothetical protein